MAPGAAKCTGGPGPPVRAAQATRHSGRLLPGLKICGCDGLTAGLDQPAHSLMLQSTDSELAPEVQSNKAKPDETQQPATISEKTEYLPELTVRSSGSKRIKAARVRLAQFAKKRNSSLHRMSVKGADGDERTFTRRKAGSDSPSLGDKLRQVVEEAARTKAGDGESAIELGDELMVFSASAEAWVPGEVVAVTEKEVQIRYAVDGTFRQKCKATIRAEV